MARLSRVVIPGIPHHVTQRGNGRQRTFFEDGDYALYLDLLAAAAERAQVEVWSYCLMPNHVHGVLVPSDQDGLWRTFGDLHRRYTGFINARRRATGHLWQGRYGSAANSPRRSGGRRGGRREQCRSRGGERVGPWMPLLSDAQQTFLHPPNLQGSARPAPAAEPPRTCRKPSHLHGSH